MWALLSPAEAKMTWRARIVILAPEVLRDLGTNTYIGLVTLLMAICTGGIAVDQREEGQGLRVLELCTLWINFVKKFSSVQLLGHVQLFATPWTAARQASLSIINFQSLLQLMSIESVMPSNHLILCHPSPSPAFNLAQHQGLFQ